MNCFSTTHISLSGEGGLPASQSDPHPGLGAPAAIQALNQKVDSGKQRAENRIEKLEAENAELKTRLSAVERIIAHLNAKAN